MAEDRLESPTLRSPEKVHRLSAETLGLSEPDAPTSTGDALLDLVLALKNDGFAGVILSGPPGTGKSYHAARIAKILTDEVDARVTQIQFHPSYQYEDFIEGFVPTEDGFKLEAKHFVNICETADAFGDETCVLVIDEISRTDPSRVFGEALTYIETTKRNIKFRLASQKEVSVPSNLFVIATMNSYDRGVADVDFAFERRFARIELEPDVVQLRSLLKDNGLEEGLIQRVEEFFNFLRGRDAQMAAVGHAYFVNVRDLASLKRLWDNQLKFHQQRVYRSDPGGFQAVERKWMEEIGTQAASFVDISATGAEASS